MNAQVSSIPKATSLHSDEYKAFLRLLRETRQNAGLTQTEVASTLGRPQSYMSKSEAGERQVNVVELVAICRAMDVSWMEFAAQLDGLLP